MKFKVGDKVRIIEVRGLPSYVLGKIGVVTGIESWPNEDTLEIDMGRPCRPTETETRWWVRESCVEQAVTIGEQLLFPFMEE